MRRTSPLAEISLLRALWTVLLVAAGAGCGTTATVTDKSGTSREVEIIRGNATHLIVATGGERIVLAKDEIADIDHPGNVMAAVGASLLIPDVVWLISPALHCDSGGQHTFCMGWLGAATFATVGLGMTAWGWAVWHHSHEMATQASSPSLALAPLVWEQGQHGNRRVGAMLSFIY